MDREKKRREARFLDHEFKRLDFTEVADLRGRYGKKKWSVAQFSHSIVAALMTNRPGFAGMEKLTSNLSAEFRKRLGLRRRLPDTTARDYVVKADLRGYRDALRKQAKSLYRSKALAQGPSMPIGMVSIDGKYRNLWVNTESSDQYPFFQTAKDPVDGRQAGEVRTISVSVVSSRATFCLDAVPVRRETNEMGMFAEVFQQFLADWGNTKLAELVATDSGSASLSNASLVNEAGYGYLMVLDNFQPELLREAQRQLGSRTAEEAEASWEIRNKGNTYIYRLWRTTEMTGWNGWDHLRQVLRLERREIHDDPSKDDTVGTRYFLTNLPVGRVSAEEWILLIRRRWAVENEIHWTLDVILREDPRPWTRDPHGILVIQMLRRIALNILALFRGVHLRSEENRLKPWQDVMEPFYDRLRFATADDLMDRRAYRRLSKAA